MSIGLPGVHPVGDLLCLVRRGEDGALVGAQHFEQSRGVDNVKERSQRRGFAPFPATFLRIISEPVESGEQARIPFP